MIRKTEEALQGQCVKWFVKNYCTKLNNPRYMIILVPNESAFSMAMSISNTIDPTKNKLSKFSKAVSNAVNVIVKKMLGVMKDKMLAMGFRDGVSDTIIVAPNKTYYVEFKLPNNIQQPNQKDFETWVTSLGHEYIVIKSLEAFQDFITNRVVCKYTEK